MRLPWNVTSGSPQLPEPRRTSSAGSASWVGNAESGSNFRRSALRFIPARRRVSHTPTTLKVSAESSMKPSVSARWGSTRSPIGSIPLWRPALGRGAGTPQRRVAAPQTATSPTGAFCSSTSTLGAPLGPRRPTRRWPSPSPSQRPSFRGFPHSFPRTPSGTGTRETAGRPSSRSSRRRRRPRSRRPSRRC